MAKYAREDHPALRGVLSIGDWWNPERVMVAHESVDTIEKHIKLRNRPHEAADDMGGPPHRRAESRRLAPGYPNTVVINRDGMEFHTRRGLAEVIAAAGLGCFAESLTLPDEAVPRRNDDRDVP